MITIVAFLGNIGQHYSQTRHNLPWMLLSELSFYPELIWKEKFKGEFAQHNIKERKIYLIKPHTYMNKSGECIRAAMHFFKSPPEKLLVVHDDTELDFAHIEFKSAGGLAGHNGLRSLASSVGTKDFKRMRLGISSPARGSLSSFVLGTFSPDESISLPLYLSSAARALEDCLLHGFVSVQEKYKKKRLIQ